MISLTSAYSKNSVNTAQDVLRLNKKLLERLATALNSWKDTSRKKTDRISEMQNAIDICDAFLSCMRSEIEGDERALMSAIFTGIKQKCSKAISGETVDFQDAVVATCFINSCIKEI
jgi:hypothetical protein